MRTIATVASLVAFSAVGLPAADAPAKIWSVSANLRGFYDDNIATTASGSATPRQASFGLEVSPTLSLKLPLDQTEIGLNYTYDMRYYENRSNSADHSHQAEAKLTHAFTPRYKLSFKDSFVLAQEASLIEPGIAATPLRSNGNNLRNIASLGFSAELTELLAIEAGYDNSIYKYEQRGITGSYSALLDRVEHLGRLDLRWQALPTTVGILGYQFGVVNQTGKDFLFGTTLPNTRDNRSHYLYVGADHDFTTQLKGAVRAGGQYTEFPNAPAGVRNNSISPYMDANVSYAYMEGSYVQLGVKHTRNQTDIGQAVDQESTLAYGVLTHKITAKLTGSLTGQYNNGKFNGGGPGINNQEESMFQGGVNLAYEINQYLSAEAGYNYDRLSSDLGGRSFSRNRVFLGIRASY